MLYKLNRTDRGGFGECPAVRVDPIVVGSILIYELVVRPTKVFDGEQLFVTFGLVSGAGANQHFTPKTARLAMYRRQFGDFASDVEFWYPIPNPLLAEVGLRGATIHAVQSSGASADSPCLLFPVIGVPGQSEYVIPELSPTELSVVEALDARVADNRNGIVRLNGQAVTRVGITDDRLVVVYGIDAQKQEDMVLPQGQRGEPGKNAIINLGRNANGGCSNIDWIKL